MGWFTRVTRFGDLSLVFSQDAENSCGIAAVRMCVYKVNKMRPERKAMFSEGFLYKAYGIASDTDYDGSVYTYTNFLAKTLNMLNCGKWEAVNVGSGGVVRAVLDSVGTDTVGLGPINTALRGPPIIVLVNWTPGGGHFVVVDTINSWRDKLYASVCDPWDGDVHVTPIVDGQPFHYKATNQAFDMPAAKTGDAAPTGLLDKFKAGAKLLADGKTSWSVGSPMHAYANTTASSGDVGGWVIRQRK